ncbi:ribonuclease Z [Candidatus Bathyarchaeota archaeon]|nr:MAG: ribonuclease Z [Candidatus Bathyarchaeota archaeon]
MYIVFLGTGGGVPTPERSLSSFILNYEGQILMFDCGEGTQHQMVKAKIGFGKETKIFITHLHGDHVLGLPGLIQTMSLLGRTKKLEIFGPKGLKEFLEASRTYIQFNLRFPVEIKEAKEGVIYKNKKFKVLARWAEHSIPNLAYAFVENKKPGKFHPEKALELGVPKGPLWHKLQHGKKVKLKNGRIIEPSQVVEPPKPGIKIVYSGDTKPCKNVLKLAKNADLLIHECTFDDSLAEKAEVEWHSTPTGVAELAKKASVKNLILTHVSARYKNTKIFLEQAKKIFPNVRVAEDLMRIEL